MLVVFKLRSTAVNEAMVVAAEFDKVAATVSATVASVGLVVDVDVNIVAASGVLAVLVAEQDFASELAGKFSSDLADVDLAVGGGDGDADACGLEYLD